ncbi:hypothetical protein F0L68_15240 [Solihabitans fulvus]|uniref:Cysteine dioxygenase type I n=1 Tax=Solihabitans fulvus TaxID=1892852 RepID=A0A5B2XDE8_9PSEU|nr:hypothetical protein [Solihabitans fulvus]KAA2261768.1 hypothetical protein F0L68_15240 [Solihabitans fulvus]
MLTRFSALGELANEINTANFPLNDHWSTVGEWFQDWCSQPGLRADLKTHLRTLPTQRKDEIISRSRETTTHFAWCLRDEQSEPFSFWVHEYKPQREWLRGYADSVHNHRYHFCTTILCGSYLHERFAAELDDERGTITSTSLLQRTTYRTGTSAWLLSHEFHRIPQAEDGTMTFLVKSRPLTRYSLSYDPETRSSRRHVPVEGRLSELTNGL